MQQILPCPHEGVVVGVQRRQLREHVIVRTLGLLPLHGGGAADQSEVSIRSRDLVSTNHSSPVVPGVVDHHTAVVETDAEHKVNHNNHSKTLQILT